MTITRVELEERAENGVRAVDIAKEFKLKIHRVYYLLQVHRLKIKTPYEILDEDKDIILELHKEMTAKEISEKWAEEYPCIKTNTVGKWLNCRGYGKRKLPEEVASLPLVSYDERRTRLDYLSGPAMITRSNGDHHVIMPADYFIDLERRANAN